MASRKKQMGSTSSPDKKLPLNKSIPLGIQHVLAMFAGNITVPIIVAGVFGQTPEEKILASKLTWEVRGVREVVNELQITDSSSIKDLAKDLAASATLRTKLITDSNISSLNFNIDVVNGTIYLSGVASNADEMNRVVAHARDVRFAQKVVNYIILQTDKRL